MKLTAKDPAAWRQLRVRLEDVRRSALIGFPSPLTPQTIAPKTAAAFADCALGVMDGLDMERASGYVDDERDRARVGLIVDVVAAVFGSFGPGLDSRGETEVLSDARKGNTMTGLEQRAEQEREQERSATRRDVVAIDVADMIARGYGLLGVMMERTDGAYVPQHDRGAQEMSAAKKWREEARALMTLSKQAVVTPGKAKEIPEGPASNELGAVRLLLKIPDGMGVVEFLRKTRVAERLAACDMIAAAYTPPATFAELRAAAVADRLFSLDPERKS